MPQFIVLHDLKDPDDPQGRSYKQVNESKVHNIPIGTLVELGTGVRLFVVSHDRDCDGTPLYAMAPDRDDTVRDHPSFANRKWVHGYPEDSLRVVDLPPIPRREE